MFTGANRDFDPWPFFVDLFEGIESRPPFRSPSTGRLGASSFMRLTKSGETKCDGSARKLRDGTWTSNARRSLFLLLKGPAISWQERF